MKTLKTFTVYCNADEAVVIADVLADYQKQIKDLETANARLFERNHELQVDNEESLKEVEEYSKRCDELRKTTIRFGAELNESKRIIEDLRNANNRLADSVVGTLETSPKSKFVITVEEF